MGIYGAKILAEDFFKEQENLKKIRFSTIENFIKNELKRNILTGNGFTIGITNNPKRKSSFEFKNIHKRAEKLYKKAYGHDNIMEQYPTINSYFNFLKKRMSNILIMFKEGPNALSKKINPKLKTLKDDLDGEIYEYIDNTLKAPLIINRTDLFIFSYLLKQDSWYFENIDFISPILENEVKTLNHDFPLITAIKYSYINAIWFKGKCLSKNLIKFKYDSKKIKNLINEKIMTLNYDNFTNYIFQNQKCINIHGSLKYINLEDFEHGTTTKLEFNNTNFDIWKNKEFMEIMIKFLKFDNIETGPKKYLTLQLFWDQLIIKN